jgi:hypothetical protein
MFGVFPSFFVRPDKPHYTDLILFFVVHFDISYGFTILLDSPFSSVCIFTSLSGNSSMFCLDVSFEFKCLTNTVGYFQVSVPQISVTVCKLRSRCFDKFHCSL